MSADTDSRAVSAVLSRIRAARPRPVPRAEERCELCAEMIGDEHSHVVDLEERALRCVCRPCFLVFAPEGAGGRRFRSVPERYLELPATASGRVWERLDIPVGVAFFFLNSEMEQPTAFYPSPAGATESLLPLDAWGELVTLEPALSTLRPDVEALLVRLSDAGRGDGRGECFIVPIDVCYELVGELRRVWRGFDGGAEAHTAIDALFARIRSRARTDAMR